MPEIPKTRDSSQKRSITVDFRNYKSSLPITKYVTVQTPAEHRTQPKQIRRLSSPLRPLSCRSEQLHGPTHRWTVANERCQIRCRPSPSTRSQRFDLFPGTSKPSCSYTRRFGLHT